MDQLGRTIRANRLRQRPAIERRDVARWWADKVRGRGRGSELETRIEY